MKKHIIIINENIFQIIWINNLNNLFDCGKQSHIKQITKKRNIIFNIIKETKKYMNIFFPYLKKFWNWEFKGIK